VDQDVYGEELDGPAYAWAERIAVVVLTATRPR
jgi:release factor glutamine methyltransferase